MVSEDGLVVAGVSSKRRGSSVGLGGGGGLVKSTGGRGNGDIDRSSFTTTFLSAFTPDEPTGVDGLPLDFVVLAEETCRITFRGGVNSSLGGSYFTLGVTDLLLLFRLQFDSRSGVRFSIFGSLRFLRAGLFKLGSVRGECTTCGSSITLVTFGGKGESTGRLRLSGLEFDFKGVDDMCFIRMYRLI